MTTIDKISLQKTDFAELEAWMDSIDFSDGFERNRRVVTSKAAFVISVQPLKIGDEPVRFDRQRMETGAEMTSIDSTTDARTVNNAVRHQYRVLSDAEKAQMQAVKDLGAAFIAKLHEIGGTDPAGDRFASRDLSLANTHAEDAVMRAVRHITA